MSQVGHARRVASACAASLGFDETAAGQVAIIATELGRNIVRYARAGELVLNPLGGLLHARPHTPEAAAGPYALTAAEAGIELLAIDHGPGLGDANRAFVDGFSTGTTPGIGLGAVKRLSAGTHVYTQSTGGTVVAVRLYARPAADPGRARPELDLSVICAPKPGEVDCGDAWAAVADGPRTVFLLADGLGHGHDAAIAARAAVQAFIAAAPHPPVPTVERIHAALRATRGAAVAVAELHRGRGVLTFAGAGNISGAILADDGSRHLVSLSGTAGAGIHRLHAFEYAWPAGAMLIMHSDGLAGHWDLERYPGLAVQPANLQAAVLYRDFRRERDDVTVLVARAAAAAPGPQP